MRPLRWWIPAGVTAIAVMFGVLPYAMLTFAGKMPVGLRDNPWALEVVAVAASVAAIALAVLAFKQKRARIVATIGATLSNLSTAVFLMLVHVASYQVPTPPKDLALGSAAPDFSLPDEAGSQVTLAGMRGHVTALVFYRGVW